MSPRRFVVCAVLTAALPAHAADAFIEGVYAGSPELCETARASPDGLQKLFEEGNVVLTARGIEGIEYHCDFLDVRKGSRTPGWVATALCEEPGYAFPDLISIMPRGEGELELVSVRDAGGDEPSGNSGTYHLCAGVAEP